MDGGKASGRFRELRTVFILSFSSNLKLYLSFLKKTQGKQVGTLARTIGIVWPDGNSVPSALPLASYWSVC